MFSLYKRGPSFWWVRWPSSLGGRRESTGCKSKRAAEEWCRAREVVIANPAAAAARSASLRQVLERYIADAETSGRAEATLRYYADVCAPLLSYFEDAPPAAVTRDSLAKYITWREHTVKPATVAKELRFLRSALLLGFADDLVERHPDKVMPRGYRAQETPRERYLTWYEAGCLLDAIPPGPRRSQVLFMIATGARLEESDRAQGDDVNLSEGFVRIRGTKTKAAEAQVPILPHVRWMLVEAVESMPWGKWNRNNARRYLHKYCERAGIEPVSPRDLRRTASQWLVDLGVPLSQVAAFLRHTSVRMVYRHYGKTEGARLGDQIKRAVG